MTRLRALVLSGLLVLAAFATMAPHYTTFGGRVWDHARISSDPNGVLTVREGKANGTVQVVADVILDLPEARSEFGLPATYRGKVRFTARPSCATPKCEDGLFQARGEIRFGARNSEGLSVQGQGTFDGTLRFSDVTGLGTEFRSHDITLRARIGTLSDGR